MTTRERVVHHVYLIIDGMIQIVEGIIKILSLGFVVPAWSIRWTFYSRKCELLRKLKGSNK